MTVWIHECFIDIWKINGRQIHDSFYLGDYFHFKRCLDQHINEDTLIIDNYIWALGKSTIDEDVHVCINKYGYCLCIAIHYLIQAISTLRFLFHQESQVNSFCLIVTFWYSYILRIKVIISISSLLFNILSFIIKSQSFQNI